MLYWARQDFRSSLSLFHLYVDKEILWIKFSIIFSLYKQLNCSATDSILIVTHSFLCKFTDSQHLKNFHPFAWSSLMDISPLGIVCLRRPVSNLMSDQDYIHIIADYFQNLNTPKKIHLNSKIILHSKSPNSISTLAQ